jgi:hypothetical protein
MAEDTVTEVNDPAVEAVEDHDLPEDDEELEVPPPSASARAVEPS